MGSGQLSLCQSGGHAGNQGVIGFNAGFSEASGEWILSLDDDSAPDLETWGGLCRILDTGIEGDSISLSVINKQQKPTYSPKSLIIDRQRWLPSRRRFNQARSADAIGAFDDELFLWTYELHWAARALA